MLLLPGSDVSPHVSVDKCRGPRNKRFAAALHGALFCSLMLFSLLARPFQGRWTENYTSQKALENAEKRDYSVISFPRLHPVHKQLETILRNTCKTFENINQKCPMSWAKLWVL